MWEVPSGKEGLTLAAHEGVVHTIAISPSGKVVASAGMDRVVKLWSVATGSELGSYSGIAARSTSLPTARTAGGWPPAMTTA